MPVPSLPLSYPLRRIRPCRQPCDALEEPAATLHRKPRRSRLLRQPQGAESQALNLLSPNSTACEGRNERLEQKHLSAHESLPRNIYTRECRDVRQDVPGQRLRNRVLFAA